MAFLITLSHRIMVSLQQQQHSFGFISNALTMIKKYKKKLIVARYYNLQF